MRSDRYKEMDNEAAESSETEVTAAEVEETAEEVESKDVVVEAEETKSEEKETPKRRFGRKSKSKKADNGEEEVDLAKMKKKDLLEIMLAQSKEIDSLRAQVADLEAQLANREFEFEKIGSIAEASLAVTNIFKDAEEAARIYLENIRRSYEKRSNKHSDD